MKEREENNFFKRMRYDAVCMLRRSPVRRSDYRQSRKKASKALRLREALRLRSEMGVAQAGAVVWQSGH